MSNSLKVLAQSVNGAMTYNFSQGSAFKVAPNRFWSTPTTSWEDQGKMYKMVLRNNKPMGGICATLCAFWIVFHAKQDQGTKDSFTQGRSVWDYLFNKGGLNIGAAMNITAEHLHASQVPGQTQFQSIENLMKKLKVNRRKKTVGGLSISNSFIPIQHSTTFQCCDAIAKVGGYKLIQLKKEWNGSGGGHMVAAWSDGTDVAFMDPNYGEFWFPNLTSFKVFFTTFMVNGYMRKGYKSMRVHNYA